MLTHYALLPHLTGVREQVQFPERLFPTETWQLGVYDLIRSSQRAQRYQCHEPARWRSSMPVRNVVGNVWECQCHTPLSHHTPHAVTSSRFRLMSLHLCLCQQRYSRTTADSIYSTMPFLSTPSLICHGWDWMALFQTNWADLLSAVYKGNILHKVTNLENSAAILFVTKVSLAFT